MVIHVINGPNLNLLGKRNTEVYGTKTLKQINKELKKSFPQVDFHFKQSNHEGEIIDYLHLFGFEKVGFVLNAGGYTHTSVALRDAIEAISAPVIEVHLSNIYEREDFRKTSLLKDVCATSIVGKGDKGYQLAVDFLLE